MLTRIDVDSENAFFLPVLGVTPKDSLLIKKVTGLNPPDVNLFIGDFSRDGGIYQGRRVGNRNVVFTIELNPNPALDETVSGLREMLYKAFMDPLVEADYLKLRLEDDEGRIRYIVGYTEKFETEIFDVENLAQISMICPDPYIRDNVDTVYSHAQGWTTVPFTYTGTAETGFEVTIYITANTNTLVLANNTLTDVTTSPDYYKGRMIINRTFVVGEQVNISTVRGSRSITVTPVGGDPATDSVSIAANLTPTSPWLELHSQSNTMRVHGATPASLPAAIRNLTFSQTYWGI